MARAFGAFANGGMRIDGRLTGNRPLAIDSVNGVPNSPQPQRVLTPETDAYVNQILQGVVTSGTGRRAALPDRPVAGKTGTTENFGDAWFVGYTPQLVTAVWVGYPNRYVPMLHEYHGKAVAGGTFPAEIWKRFTDERAQAPRRPAGDVPGAAAPLPVAAPGRVPQRADRARQRLLPVHERDRLLRQRRPGPEGELQEERGRGAARDRDDARRGEGPARAAAARRGRRLQARRAAPAGGHRDRRSTPRAAGSRRGTR